jgi:diguanylate cyclase (GGDEF)-like protein
MFNSHASAGQLCLNNPVKSLFRRLRGERLEEAALALLVPALAYLGAALFAPLEPLRGLLCGGAAAFAGWRGKNLPFTLAAGSTLFFEAFRLKNFGWSLSPTGAAQAGVFFALAASGAGLLALRRRLWHEIRRRARSESHGADLESGEDLSHAQRRLIASDRDAHLRMLLALAHRSLGAHSTLFLESAAGDAFRIRLWESAGGLRLEDEALVPPDAFPLRRVLAGEVFVSGPRAEPFEAWPCVLESPPFRSVAAAELSLGAGRRGILALFHPEAQAFAGESRESLRLWGAHIASSMELWRRVARTEESARELRILHEGLRRMAALTDVEAVGRALLELLREAVHCDAAAVCLFYSLRGGEGCRVLAVQDEAFLSWEERKTSDSWAKWIFEHAEEAVAMGSMKNASPGMPLYSHQENRERFRSFAGAPLASAKRRFGALVAGRVEEEAFDAHSVQVLSLLASHAALAMEAASMYEKLETLAVTDGLTGLYNHRRFRQMLDEEIRRCERTGDVFSLLLMDLDHFKRVNDTQGHPAGDALLRGVAALLGRQLRDVDLLARYGGEEFAALLLGSAAAEAMKSAERLRAAVEGASFPHEGRALDVTLSLGAATWPENGHTAQTLVESADRALYASKHAGRNRSTHASSTSAGGGQP